MGSALRCLPLAIVLLFCARAAVAGPAVASGPIATRFEVYGFAGVHVLSLHSRIDESGDQYAIAVDYATHGLASILVNLRTQAEVRGRLVAGAAQPDWFRKATERNGVARHDQIVYGAGGSLRTSTSPAPSDPLPAAETRGTVDNLTAYFRLERQLARTGRCAVTERVFDGRNRYDLVFTDVGRQKLAPEAGQNFAGDTIACHMTRYFRASVSSAEAQEGARSGTIWYARLVPGDVLVPVRMKLDTQLGVVDAYLSELHGRGVNLTLTE